jgi:O-antigen ligase
MLLRPALRLDARRLARWLVWAGYTLGAIAALRWLGALPMPGYGEDNLRAVGRALPADYALVIGLALIAAVYTRIAVRSTVQGWPAIATFGVATIFLQHRSVWMATAAGLVWFSFRTARSSVLQWVGLLTIGITALSITALVIPEVGEGVELMVATNIQETQSEQSTWLWRVQGYGEAVDRIFNSDSTDILVGPPAGWGTDSQGSFASKHIHSQYIDTLAYYGIAGLGVLLLWIGVLARRAVQRFRPAAGRRMRDDRGAALLQALLLSEVVYFVPYGGGLLQGTVLGLLWVATTQTQLPAIARRIASPAFTFRRANTPGMLVTRFERVA